MPEIFCTALRRLKFAGLRPTRQRLVLARLLFDGDPRHVAAEWPAPIGWSGVNVSA
jgi:hypothetical protein